MTDCKIIYCGLRVLEKQLEAAGLFFLPGLKECKSSINHDKKMSIIESACSFPVLVVNKTDIFYVKVPNFYK